MVDYKKMYFELFNKITDIIGELQNVQRLTEEMYLSSEMSKTGLKKIELKEVKKNKAPKKIKPTNT